MSLLKTVKTKWRNGKIMITSGEGEYERTLRLIYCREIFDGTMFPSVELEGLETKEEFLAKFNLKEGFSLEEFRAKITEFERLGYVAFRAQDIIDAGLIPEEIAAMWRRHFAELNKILEPVNCCLSKDSGRFCLKDEDIVEQIDLGKASELFSELVARVGRLKDKWIAEFAYPNYCEYDEIERHYFSFRPTLNDIVTAVLAHRIDRYFEHSETPTIVCQLCRRELHWADIDADSLFERLRMIENSRCCCPRKPRRKRIPQ